MTEKLLPMNRVVRIIIDHESRTTEDRTALDLDVARIASPLASAANATSAVPLSDVWRSNFHQERVLRSSRPKEVQA